MSELEPLYTAFLEGSLRLSKFGEWFHNNSAFEHERLTKLFNQSIVWDQTEMQYTLRIGKGRAFFKCEDTAWFVTALKDKTSPWEIILSDGSTEVLNPKSLCIGKTDQIYCIVKGNHLARLKRNVVQQVLEYAEGENSILIDNIPITPGRIER